MAKHEKAAKIGAPRDSQEWRGEYDFAEDGGAVGSFPLRGDEALPEGTVVYDGYVDVEESVEGAVGRRREARGGAGESRSQGCQGREVTHGVRQRRWGRVV
jgi:hypothetical protein